MRNVEENVCGCPLGLDLDLDLRRKNFITGSLPFTLFVSDLVEMGVSGLTTFVDDNNHLLTDHRLHDTTAGGLAKSSEPIPFEYSCQVTSGGKQSHAFPQKTIKMN